VATVVVVVVVGATCAGREFIYTQHAERERK